MQQAAGLKETARASVAKAAKAEVGGQATGADVAEAAVNEAEEGSKRRGGT